MECEIRVSETLTANNVRVYVGQTRRFTSHYPPTRQKEAVQPFLVACHQLIMQYLPEQDFTGFERVLWESKSLLEREAPALCLVYLSLFWEGGVALVIVFDRLSTPLDTKTDILTILPTKPPPEGSASLPSVEAEPAVGAREAAGEAMESLEGDLAWWKQRQQKLLEASRKALVAEVQDQGTRFWVCHYFKAPVQAHPFRIPIFKILAHSGDPVPEGLQGLVWMASESEGTRDVVVSLAAGNFAILRSEQLKNLVAIVQLDA